jgi:hypothetical protein
VCLWLVLPQVRELIKSYRVAELLNEYVSGTRRWMMESINAWLGSSLDSLQLGEGMASVNIPPGSRLLLLLADPGMGKSVMSAAMECKLDACAHKGRQLVQVRLTLHGEWCCI